MSISVHIYLVWTLSNCLLHRRRQRQSVSFFDLDEINDVELHEDVKKRRLILSRDVKVHSFLTLSLIKIKAKKALHIIATRNIAHFFHIYTPPNIYKNISFQL